MKKAAHNDSDLHYEHKALISYLTSKLSPSVAAQTLCRVLLLVSGKDAPDVLTTIRYCLEDGRISGELGKLLRQNAETIKRDYGWLTDDHMDVKYNIESRSTYDDWECERAIEILGAVNDFYTAEGSLDRVAYRNPAVIDKSVLDGLPLVIRRLGSANPEEGLSRRVAPQLKELIERSKALAGTEFIVRDWNW